MNNRTPLTIYATSRMPCPYLSVKIMRNGVADCNGREAQAYPFLIKKGFRRNGESLYRPFCDNCHACVSTRLIVDQLTLNRSQKRCMKRNQDLIIRVNSGGFRPEYQALYERYVNSRHEETPTDHVEEFFDSHWCDTLYIEMYKEAALIAVAVVDIVSDGLSAVYTFFEPDSEPNRSLGTFAVLWQAELAKTYRKPYVYLGYWVDECRKMRYKTRFQPLEGFINEAWVAIDKAGQKIENTAHQR